MLKSLFKTLIILIIYYLLNFSLEKLFIFIFVRDIFSEVHQDYFLFINTFIYILYIIVSFFILNKKGFIRGTTSIQLQKIIIIVILVLSFRILEDPIQRIKIIIGNLTLPDTVNNNTISHLGLIITFINTIFLAPLFEELFFRKLMLSYFSRDFFLIGILISSLTFSMIHIDWGLINPSQLIVFFIFGLITSIIYSKYGLFYSVLFHSGYNLIWFLAKVDVIKYWSILKNLNFGITYWLLVIVSFLFIVYFIFKFYLINQRGNGSN